MPFRDQAKAAIAVLDGKEVYGRKIALEEAEQKEQEKSNNFQRPRREFRSSDGAANEEIDGNKVVNKNPLTLAAWGFKPKPYHKAGKEMPAIVGQKYKKMV